MKKKKLFADSYVDGRFKERQLHGIGKNRHLITLTRPVGYIKDESALPGSTGEFSLDFISDVEVDTEEVRKTSKKINANDLIAEYYEDYFKENGLTSERPSNVLNCFKSFDIDVYHKNKVKDIKRTNLCHDKFCINCQNMASQLRFIKYKPELDRLLKDYSIFHIVFTVPNCSDVMLSYTLQKMNDKFATLIRYFQCKKKIKGLDFSTFGYVGAVKSLEIVIHEKGFLSEFHPHFHCLFVLDKKFRDVGSHVNTYSHSKSEIKDDCHVKNGVRFFSDFDIILQKIWYLLFNNIKVTKKAIDELELGYSVCAQRVITKYKDVFKYCMKGLFDPKTSRFMYSYKTFKTLYESIHRKKIIQGYGILNKFSFLTEEELEEHLSYYNEVITALRLEEDPELRHVKLKELVKDMENGEFKYISKKSVLSKKYKADKV